MTPFFRAFFTMLFLAVAITMYCQDPNKDLLAMILEYQKVQNSTNMSVEFYVTWYSLRYASIYFLTALYSAIGGFVAVYPFLN